MQNFDWTSFTKRIAVRTDLSTMYDAWTKASELEKWFLSRVIFHTSDNKPYDRDARISAGIKYEWYWYLYDDPMPGVIKQTNGLNFIQFTFEGECLVDVTLEQKDKYVIVTLRHHNIPPDDKSKQFVRLGCSNGWTFYLSNLKSIYEGGLDLRNKEEELGTMINN